jgi:chitinase
MKWYLFLLFPSVQSYLFGCYYDYSQPLVLPEQLPLGTCTHVLLIGAVFVKNFGVNVIQHPYNGFNALQSMRDYRARDSNKLKVLVSFLAFGDDAEWQAAMKDPESRMKFIMALMEFAKSQVIDGFDFDWEYPCGDYKSLYTNFIVELRAIVHQTFGEQFLLTTAVGAGKNTIDNCYEIGKLGQVLDLIHLMTYDYHCKFVFYINKTKSY